jgi:hypothetical protein
LPAGLQPSLPALCNSHGVHQALGKLIHSGAFSIRLIAGELRIGFQRILAETAA